MNMQMISDPGNLLHHLEPISLQKSNLLASMQDRIDNKYLLNYSRFQAFLDSIKTGYAVLEIDNRRQFRYASCYYDDGDTSYSASVTSQSVCR